VKTLSLGAIVFLCVVSAPLLAQADEEADLQRQIALAQKKLTVSKNIQLTDKDKAAFWPVYDQYQEELFEVNQRVGKLIGHYARSYKTLSDVQAQSMLREYLDIREKQLKLKQSYVKKFEEVLPSNKVLRYYQVENKLEAIARFELSKRIPLASESQLGGI